MGQGTSKHPTPSQHLPSDASSSSSTGTMRQKVQGKDDSLKEDSPEINLLPDHQRLNHLAAELPTLVDSLTKDCLEYEKALTSLRMDHDCGKAKKKMWKRLYKHLKRENEEVLKENLGLKCDLHAEKMEIKELETKLEGEVEEMDGHENLDKLPNTAELLCEDELQDCVNELTVLKKEELLKKILELERELSGKQTLDIEIQELKGKIRGDEAFGRWR